jgi:hypothetical protein
MAQAHAALLEQQPAEPPDRGALIAIGFLVAYQETDHQRVVERRRAREIGDSHWQKERSWRTAWPARSLLSWTRSRREGSECCSSTWLSGKGRCCPAASGAFGHGYELHWL